MLTQYDFHQHVPSDVGINGLFLPPENFKLQENFNNIADWTQQNLMKLNEKKSNYIVFSRSKHQFNTRLNLNGIMLERKSVVKVLGIWLQEDLKWDTQVKQICIKAYSRVQILSKLKYAGIVTHDLLDIFKLFIRSVCEYCSVVYHISLTCHQIQKLESIQKTCLKIILGDEYTSYIEALNYCSLETLELRRENTLKDSL